MATAEAPEIVLNAVAGDKDAFAAIYQQEHALVFRFILKRVHHTPLAQDLTADVFVKALRYISGFRWEGTGISAWLLSIARTRIADHYRAKHTWKELPAIWEAIDNAQTLADTSTDGLVEEFVVEHMANVSAMQVMRRLSREQQTVLVLRYLKDLTIEETAAIMGLTEGGVKGLTYRAIRSMARLMPPGGRNG